MVVTIIIILAGAALFASIRNREQTYKAVMENDLHNYALAQASHKLDAGTYASAPESLGAAYAYSRGTMTVRSVGTADRWILLVGHSGTTDRCRFGGGSLSGTLSQMVCGNNIALPPVAEFTSRPTPATTDDYVYFNAAGSQGGGAPIASYNWGFGDGTNSNGAAVGHQFGSTGVFQVQLIVMDTLGVADTTTQSITVQAPSGGIPTSPIAPALVIDADSGVGRPLPASFTPYLAAGLQHVQGTCGANCQLVAEAIRFDASTTTGPGDLYSLRIENVGSPPTIDATTTGTTKQWTFMKPRPGNYRAVLTVQDSGGTQVQSTNVLFSVATPPPCQALSNDGHIYSRLSSTNSNGIYTAGYPFPNPDCSNADIYQVGQSVCYYGFFFDLASPLYTPDGGGRRYQGGAAPADHNPWTTQFDFGGGSTSTPTEYDTMYWDPSGGPVDWRSDLQTTSCHTYAAPGLYTTRYTATDRFGSGSTSVQVIVTP